MPVSVRKARLKTRSTDIRFARQASSLQLMGVIADRRRPRLIHLYIVTSLFVIRLRLVAVKMVFGRT